MRFSLIVALAATMLGGQAAHADQGDPKIADVEIKRDREEQPGIFHIKVTIEHQDTGWDDYVDAWEIFAPDGQILGQRPFFEPDLEDGKTVSALSGVVIPEDVKTAIIRARMHPHGHMGDPVEIAIPH